jgi:hypothetical protein
MGKLNVLNERFPFCHPLIILWKMTLEFPFFLFRDTWEEVFFTSNFY